MKPTLVLLALSALPLARTEPGTLATAACRNVPGTVLPLDVASVPGTDGTDPAALLPDGVQVYVEAPGASALFAQGLRHPLLARVLDSPVGDLLREEVGSPGALLVALSLQVGRPVLPSLAKLTEGGVALGLVPRAGGQPIACLAARGDAQEWSEVLELALRRLAEARGLDGDALATPSRRARGMDVWALGDAGSLALADGLLLAANDAGALETMLALAEAQRSAQDDDAVAAPGSLAASAEFQRARAAYRTPEALLWSWLDLEGLERSTPGGLGELREVPRQPAAQLLLGSAIANLAGARGGAVELRLGDDRVELDVVGLDAPQGAAAKLLAPRKSGAPALPAPSADETARGSLYRDLATVFRERAELFPPRAQPGFAEATSNLALFFGGQDVTDEVLPRLEPWIGFVARPVAFDPRAVPEVPLPGAALLLRAKDPETMGPELVAAMQSLLAVLNIEAAQQQQPILTVNLELYEGTTITYGRYRTPAEGEGVDARYNLEPACAMVGDTFVLGTHRAVVEQVVGQLTRGEVTRPGLGESLELSGAEVARVIAANEEALVVNAVVSDGKSEAVARREVAGLKAVAGLVDGLRLETARPAASDLRASLRLLLEGGR